MTDAKPIEHPPLCGCADCEARYEQAASKEDDFILRCAPQGPTAEVIAARRGITHRDIAGERELALIARYQGGDKHAGEILLRAHTKLISYFGMKYASAMKHDLAPEDILTVAQLGFLKAARRFDPKLGFKLATYAQHWIRSTVREEVVDAGKTIRVPAYHYDKRAKQTGLRFAREAQAASGAMVSIHTPLSEGDKRTLADLIEDTSPLADEQLADAGMSKSVDGLLDRAHLTDPERYIMEQRFVADEPKTLQAIGDDLGVSRERVRQLEAKAIVKLRKAYTRAVPEVAAEVPKPLPPLPPPTVCGRCGYEGHGTKTCERWAGKKFGMWTVERVGPHHVSKGGTVSTTIVVRCSKCQTEKTERAEYLKSRGCPPCECKTRKKKAAPKPVVVEKKEPKKLPVVSELTLSEPVDAESVAVPTDRFRCVPYEAVLFANACVKRQDLLASARLSRVLEYSRCKGCRIGQRIRERLAAPLVVTA